MTSGRRKAEEKCIKVMDILDPTHTNSDYYKKVFAEMSDKQFEQWLRKKLPIKFHFRPFEIEPAVATSIKALNFMGVPLMEKIKQPWIYTNPDGKSPYSKEAFTGYIHLKKLKQFGTKKNHLPLSSNNRDMKSGLLVGEDKGARESDREFEALGVMGLTYTAKEFSTFKADSMNAKDQAYNTINTLGDVYMKDIEFRQDDSLSRNMISSYMIGAHLMTNLVVRDYMTPATFADKRQRVRRETE